MARDSRAKVTRSMGCELKELTCHPRDGSPCAVLTRRGHSAAKSQGGRCDLEFVGEATSRLWVESRIEFRVWSQ